MGCFKPKIPKAQPNPDLTIQRTTMEQEARDVRANNKRSRLEATMDNFSGRTGRNSLFASGAGGAGFGAPLARSLFVKV